MVKLSNQQGKYSETRLAKVKIEKKFRYQQADTEIEAKQHDELREKHVNLKSELGRLRSADVLNLNVFSEESRTSARDLEINHAELHSLRNQLQETLNENQLLRSQHEGTRTENQQLQIQQEATIAENRVLTSQQQTILAENCVLKSQHEAALADNRILGSQLHISLTDNAIFKTRLEATATTHPGSEEDQRLTKKIDSLKKEVTSINEVLEKERRSHKVTANYAETTFDSLSACRAEVNGLMVANTMLQAEVEDEREAREIAEATNATLWTTIDILSHEGDGQSATGSETPSPIPSPRTIPTQRLPTLRLR